MTAPARPRDAVVIGAGLAGLVAALRLARAGRSVTLVSFGVGGPQLSQGTLDILGYAPDRVLRPLEAVASVPATHPYAAVGPDAVRDAISWLATELDGAFVGDPAVNLHLPTAVGAIRPTALAPASMAAADARGGLTYAVVGVRQLKDFQADLVAANLARSCAPDGGALAASAAWIDLPARPGEADPSGLTYARALDNGAFAARFADAVAAAAPAGDVVLVPAVLGVRRPDVWAQVQRRVGRPVAEVALQPPSVPGIRLFEALLRRVKAAGVRYLPGSRVVGFAADGGRIASVRIAAAGGARDLVAQSFVFAPGGFESGALAVDSHGRITEPAFGLPLTADDAAGLVGDDWWGPQPLFEVGVRTDATMRPTDAAGAVVHENLFVAGSLLAGAQRWREKSGDGIAVATAVRAADSTGGVA